MNPKTHSCSRVTKATTTRAQREHKQEMARLRRRRLTIIRKLDEFHELCGAEMYMAMYMNSRWIEYSSSDNPSWPPQRSQIVGTHDAYEGGPS